MQAPLDKAAHHFRSAILAGDHAEATRLLAEYVKALCLTWDLLPQHERTTSGVPRQALELLAWARAVTITQRVLASEQLAIVDKVIRYRPAAAAEAQPHNLEVSI